jgi:uncharacterized C2H2 Zn-finger protein
MLKNQVKQQNITCEDIVATCSCPHCQQIFTCQKGLTKHINQLRCKVVRNSQLKTEVESDLRVGLKIESNNELATISQILHDKIKEAQTIERQDQVNTTRIKINEKIRNIEVHVPPLIYKDLLQVINFEIDQLLV